MNAAPDYFAFAADLARDAGEQMLRNRIAEAQAELAHPRSAHDRQLDICHRVLNAQLALARYYETQGMSRTAALLAAQSA